MKFVKSIDYLNYVLFYQTSQNAYEFAFAILIIFQQASAYTSSESFLTVK